MKKHSKRAMFIFATILVVVLVTVLVLKSFQSNDDPYRKFFKGVKVENVIFSISGDGFRTISGTFDRGPAATHYSIRLRFLTFDGEGRRLGEVLSTNQSVADGQAAKFILPVSDKCQGFIFGGAFTETPK
jgi:hypothetical protein